MRPTPAALLRFFELEAADLPEIVSEWPDTCDGERLSTHWWWLQMMDEWIQALNQAQADGVLTDDEVRRYQALRELLSQSEDALRLLDVSTLDEVEAYLKRRREHPPARPRDRSKGSEP